jgi:hypothetical protein
MGGGLMQLVAYGAQDIYLTGNPQITFFKVVYRRHTNFSMESIRQTPNGNGDNQTVTISRNGDLVHKIYIEWTYGDASRTTDDAELNKVERIYRMLGTSNLIKRIECEIGGQLIDRQSGSFLQMHNDLTELNPTGSELSKYNNNVLRGGMGNMRSARLSSVNNISGFTTFWTPLKFWFCKNPGLALPLIALQYHEVKLNVELDTSFITTAVNADWKLGGEATGITHDYWVDYIYLDTDERRRFAQVSHEYLIEQVQEQTHSVTFTTGVHSNKVDLVFNHPVKELMWVWQNDYTFETQNLKHMIGGNMNDTGDTEGGITLKDTKYQLKLNGHDRFSLMPATYFTRTQVWKYHTGSSLNRARSFADTSDNLTKRWESMINNTWSTDYINVYSFALKPEEHQPSGTCNFSRIDNAILNYDVSWTDSAKIGYTNHSTNLLVYAVNYNVLRIMSGMGGLAYSN